MVPPGCAIPEPQRSGLNRRRLLAACLLAGGLGLGAVAQATPTEPAAVPSAPVHMVVMGDSLAEGVWGSLYRHFYRTRAIRVINAAAASTGFNRTPYEESLRDILQRHPIDMLVMFTGANDAQDAQGLDGGAHAAFGSERWRPLYERRVQRFLDLVQARGLDLLWIGLPAMRSPAFESRIAQVRDAQRALCAAYDVPYFDLNAVTRDDEGAYISHKRDDAGRLRLLRYEDGVHLTEFGCDQVAGMILHYVLDSRPRWLSPDIEQIIRPVLRS